LSGDQETIAPGELGELLSIDAALELNSIVGGDVVILSAARNLSSMSRGKKERFFAALRMKIHK
jgi:hypothetical protein